MDEYTAPGYLSSNARTSTNRCEVDARNDYRSIGCELPTTVFQNFAGSFSDDPGVLLLG